MCGGSSTNDLTPSRSPARAFLQPGFVGQIGSGTTTSVQDGEHGEHGEADHDGAETSNVLRQMALVAAGIFTVAGAVGTRKSLRAVGRVARCVSGRWKTPATPANRLLEAGMGRRCLMTVMRANLLAEERLSQSMPVFPIANEMDDAGSSATSGAQTTGLERWSKHGRRKPPPLETILSFGPKGGCVDPFMLDNSTLEATTHRGPDDAQSLSSSEASGFPVFWQKSQSTTLLWLEELAAKLSAPGTDLVPASAMAEAIDALNGEFDCNLLPNDADRLFFFLGGVGDAVTKAGFVTGALELVTVLERVKEQLTMKQLRAVVAHSFDRFDLNDDGNISAEELAVAMKNMGLEVGMEDVMSFHRFFATRQNIERSDLVEDHSLEEKWICAMQGSLSSMQSRYGMPSVSHMVNQIKSVMDGPGDWLAKLEKVAHAANEGVEHLAASAELAVSSAGMALAASYIGSLVNDAGGLASMDISSAAPFMIFLGLSSVNLAKELDELVLQEMSEIEALLYHKVFEGGGFSQSQFCRLLHCTSCQVATAQPGEVLNEESDRTVKIIVRGRADVRDHCCTSPSGRGGQVLQSGCIIGGTLLMRDQAVWEGHDVVVKDEVTFVSWQVDDLKELLEHNAELRLRFDRLLAASMMQNLLMIARKGRKREELRSRRAQEDAEAFPMPVLPMAPTKPSREALGEDRSGSDVIGREELTLLLTHVQQRLGLCHNQRELNRLLAYFDPIGSGFVTVSTLKEKTAQLEDALGALSGFSMEELSAVLRRSAVSLVQGDARLTVRDFWSALQKLEVTVSEEHASILHSFMDVDKDGFVDFSEQGHDGRAIVNAVHVAISSEMERKGWKKCLYFAKSIKEVLAGPGNPSTKMAKLTQTVWYSTDEVADFLENAMDVAGVGAALRGIWEELNGLTPDDGIDELNLAPFLIFIGISMASTFKHLSDGRVSDLSEREAVAYTKYFEGNGFTVSDFQKIMKHGNAEWERMDIGASLSTDPTTDTHLKLVTKGHLQSVGRCGTRGIASSAVANVYTGEFVGEAAFLGGGNVFHSKRQRDASVVLYPVDGPVKTLNLDVESLRAYLEHDEKLKLKLHRLVSVSLADRLLRTCKRSGEM